MLPCFVVLLVLAFSGIDSSVSAKLYKTQSKTRPCICKVDAAVP